MASDLLPSPFLPPECWGTVLDFLDPTEEFFAVTVCQDWCELLKMKRQRRGDSQWRTRVGKAVGSISRLHWARENGCPCDGRVMYLAARGGHLSILQWARENGVDLDACTFAEAGWRGSIPVLECM